MSLERAARRASGALEDLIQSTAQVQRSGRGLRNLGMTLRAFGVVAPLASPRLSGLRLGTDVPASLGRGRPFGSSDVPAALGRGRAFGPSDVPAFATNPTEVPAFILRPFGITRI